MEISEKEFAVIRELANNHLPDQRTIASRTGISLGLTNLIIQKLVKTGYVKVQQLNRKKIQYLLTPKGFSEKTRKSYNFAIRTIDVLKTIREEIQQLVTEYHSKGAYHFEISGNSELANIAELAFRNLPVAAISYSRSKDASAAGVALTVSFTEEKRSTTIDLLGYISEAGLFYH